MKIKVSRFYLEYLSRFCAETEDRKFLMGIKFDFKEKSLCGSDGHVLAYIPADAFEVDDDEGVEELILQFHIPSIKKLSKKIKELELDVRRDINAVIYDNRAIGIIIDGTYPPFKHLFPNTGSEMKLDEIALNPNLLNKFYVEKGVHGVCMTFYGQNKAIKVDVMNVPELRGLIMPMRIN